MNSKLIKIKKDVENFLRQNDESVRPFSTTILLLIKSDLEEMSAGSEATLSFPRVILDWPQDSKLKDDLIQLAYDYDQLKRHNKGHRRGISH